MWKFSLQQNWTIQVSKLLALENKEISYFDSPVLTPSQIKKFQKIFSQNTIEENNEDQEVNEKLTIILDQQEKEAFIYNLRTTVCCKAKTCLAKIDHESAFNIFDNVRKLSKAEYNMLLLGMLHAMTRSKETLRGKEKQYLTVKYTFDGKEICEKGFQIIYSLSNKKWKNIRQHYHISSIKPIKNALSGRKSHNALSFVTILNVLTFIVNFANCNGLPSPGRHFREDTMAITFLPANESYSGLCHTYQSNLEEDSDHHISQSSFMRIWKKYVPEIRFLSSRSDLCMLCKNMQFNTQYWTENKRDYNIQEWNNHIKWANQEREFYKQCILNTKQQVKNIINLSKLLRLVKPNSLELENHILWDFTEAVHLPFSSQQEV
ncbi:23271_t:CDS:2 [Cetraspora pellucida]|uniref:23271_t:CDS:1 n=1 Tax=Cetraspora pellucida TaxID=1433469 RepID=A0A9N9GQX9_9GLOM|nr:23271_t:CDS:2 [Cetraspora pellucida]